jgi:hypothetical protein
MKMGQGTLIEKMFQLFGDQMDPMIAELNEGMMA